MDVATRTISIGRPRATVQSQFADVAHHERSQVHRASRFTVLEESPVHCDYEQVSRQGPVRFRQRFHLDRSDPSHQVNTVTAGSFRGGAIIFDFESQGFDSTIVTATLQSPRRLMRVARPLLGPVLGRALAKGLEEDKHDLESGSYPAADRNRSP